MSTRQSPQLIVGVDRSPGGRAALRVAAAEAIRRGVPLHAVRVRSFLLGPVDDFSDINSAFDETSYAKPAAPCWSCPARVPAERGAIGIRRH